VKKKFAPIAGYALLFAAMLAVFIPRGIDGEAVRGKLEALVQEKTGVELSIGALELSLPFSATLRDAVIRNRRNGVEIHLDRLEVKIVFWRLLLLSPTVRLKMVEKNGYILADISPAVFSKRVGVRLESRSFPVDSAVVKVNGAPLPVMAALDADMEAVIPPDSMPDISVQGQITLNGLGLKSGSVWDAMLKGLIPKTARCSVSAKNRSLSTSDCGISTSMGEVQLQLSSALMQPVEASPLSGAVVLAASGKLADTAALLYGKYRKPDGAYYFPLAGTLGTPLLAP